MIAWSVIVLVLALLGTIVHLGAGTHPNLLWNDIIMLLLAVGILFRIHYKTQEGEKESLEIENKTLRSRILDLNGEIRVLKWIHEMTEDVAPEITAGGKPVL